MTLGLLVASKNANRHTYIHTRFMVYKYRLSAKCRYTGIHQFATLSDNSMKRNGDARHNDVIMDFDITRKYDVTRKSGASGMRWVS